MERTNLLYSFLPSFLFFLSRKIATYGMRSNRKVCYTEPSVSSYLTTRTNSYCSKERPPRSLFQACGPTRAAPILCTGTTPRRWRTQRTRSWDWLQERSMRPFENLTTSWEFSLSNSQRRASSSKQGCITPQKTNLPRIKRALLGAGESTKWTTFC